MGSTILVVDDDEGTVATVSTIIRAIPATPLCAQSASGALALARVRRLDFALVDHRLPDGDGLQLACQLMAERIVNRWVMITGWATVPLAVAAMKNGASNVLEKPLSIEELERELSLGLRRSEGDDHDPAVLTRCDTADAVTRLTSMIARVIRCPRDPRTIELAARTAGVSASTFKTACRRLRLSPHDVRDFARIARALMLSATSEEPVDAWLDVSDDRTERRLLKRGGVLRSEVTCPADLDSFLHGQSFIDSGHPVLRALKDTLLQTVSGA